MKIFKRGSAVLFSRVWNRFEFDSPLSAILLHSGDSNAGKREASGILVHDGQDFNKRRGGRIALRRIALRCDLLGAKLECLSHS